MLYFFLRSIPLTLTMKRITLLLIMFILYFIGCSSVSPPASIDDYRCYPDAVYLFRHAEKQKIKGEKNPELTKKGFLRANALADSLALIQNGVIFSSEYARTQQTVSFLAEKWGADINIHTASDPEGQIEKVMDLCNKTILISGHSNTIPALIKLFGFKEEVVINDDQYGDLFMLTWPSGVLQLSLKRIGE